MVDTTQDVVIVGAGVSGLLAAYELLRLRPRATLTLVDAGLSLDERLRQGTPTSEGYGGAGLYLGGSLYFGTTTLPVMPPVSAPTEMRPVVEGEAFERRARVVDALFTELGATAPWRPAPAESLAQAIAQARAVGIDYVTNYPARRLAPGERHGVLRRLQSALTTQGAHLLTGMQATSVTRDGDDYLLTLTATPNGENAGQQAMRLRTRAVLLAPGRYGAEWLTRVAGDLDARILPLPTTYGVRLELPATTYDPLTDVNSDPRLQMTLPGDALIKTYATCPGGVVTPVTRYGALVASGVPALRREQRGPTTTLALLIQPGAQGATGTWGGGETSARLLNERMPGRLVVQRMEDVRQRRATSDEALARNSVRPSCADAIPGALHDAYPDAYWQACESFLGRIDRLAPGTLSGDALVYGPAEERFWYFPTDDQLQTTAPGLFVAGDGPGQSQGIIQASIAGLLAGEGLARYLG
ncbi:MAG TPA: hypothetical protein VKQ36_05085 [Ktedonobacterales bacterium]|nr:hypothetical protein [Ktedonobacterales bacterium]